jgi:2-aminoethylphosphonate-pyruvate transaminase
MTRIAGRPYVLFNPGPVNLHARLREELFDIELCHRQPEFDEIDARVKAGLYGVAGFSPDGHRLGLLHGSGTLAVDAALTTFVRGTALVVDNGLYCRRFIRTLAGVSGAVVEHHPLAMGGRVDLDALDEHVRRTRPEWVAVVHHETTTGLLNPLAEIVGIAGRHGSRVLVDAVSSFGAHPLESAADVVCFNGNKCLESLPGVAGVFWNAELRSHSAVPVLDVSAYEGMPSTPNVQAVIALDIALELLAAEDRPARYHRLARHVWRSGGRYFEPFLDEVDRSNVLTSFRLGGRDPDELFERALAHGYVIYHGQEALRGEIFRVANMGAVIDESLIDDLFEVLGA